MGLRRGKGNSKGQKILTVGEAFDSAQGKLLQHSIKRLLKVSNILPFHQFMGYRDP